MLKSSTKTTVVTDTHLQPQLEVVRGKQRLEGNRTAMNVQYVLNHIEHQLRKQKHNLYPNKYTKSHLERVDDYTILRMNFLTRRYQSWFEVMIDHLFLFL